MFACGGRWAPRLGRSFRSPPPFFPSFLSRTPPCLVKRSKRSPSLFSPFPCPLPRSWGGSGAPGACPPPASEASGAEAPTPAGTWWVTVTAGNYPSEISWTLSCDDGTLVTGQAPYNQQVSVSPGASCQLQLQDSYGDGWNGAYWEGLGQLYTLTDGYDAVKSFTAPTVRGLIKIEGGSTFDEGSGFEGGG